MLKYIQKMRWAGMKKEFAKIGVPIVESGDDWKAIMEIKKVRDCIAPERAEWHTKARSVGLSLPDLVRRAIGRVRTLDHRSRREPPRVRHQTGAHRRPYGVVAGILR